MRNRRDAERNNMGKKQEETGGRAMDGSSTKGTVCSSSEQRAQNEWDWALAAPITEREGWKRRVEQSRSVPCREDVFLSVLVAPLLSHNGVQNEAEQRSQWSQRKGIKIWAVLYMLDTLGKLNSSDSFLSCTTLPDNNQLLNMLCVFALVED